MAYRIHDLAGDGVDAYFDTAEEAATAIAAAKQDNVAAKPITKKPAEKPSQEEEATP